MWHGVEECQPIKFSHAKAIFVFQMLCWIAKKNVLYIFFTWKHKKLLHFAKKKNLKKTTYIVGVYIAGFISVTWLGDGVVVRGR